jgi:hypothetical protein
VGGKIESDYKSREEKSLASPDLAFISNNILLVPSEFK